MFKHIYDLHLFKNFVLSWVGYEYYKISIYDSLFISVLSFVRNHSAEKYFLNKEGIVKLTFRCETQVWYFFKI